MIDMVQRVHPRARFFYVDTGLLFPETYETRDALAERYGLEFGRRLRGGAAAPPLTSGASTDACCADRKVELMRRPSTG